MVRAQKATHVAQRETCPAKRGVETRSQDGGGARRKTALRRLAARSFRNRARLCKIRVNELRALVRLLSVQRAIARD